MDMNEVINEETEMPRKHFIGYEYKEMTAEPGRASFLMDSYECFGWEPDKNLPENRNIRNPQKPKKVTICLKRNRKIINKMELTRLQRNFEACMNEIDMLERAKTSKAAMLAWIAAMIGTAFLAGATFAVTAQPPLYILMVVLAVPGFLGWISPYFLYQRVVKKQTEKMVPLIEEKYDEIYTICEKGNKLLKI